MSVVAAKVYEDHIEIAADSIRVNSCGSKRTTGMSKLDEINGMVIGGVGTAAEQSLMFRFAQTHKPESSTERDVLTFVVEFARWKVEITGDSSVNNSYVIAFDGHAFVIDSMAVSEITDFEAIGAGQDFANTAMYLGHIPAEAVEVACELSCYVAKPVIQYTVKR